MTLPSLRHDEARSYGACEAPPNLLLHADNARGLPWLAGPGSAERPSFRALFRCVYLDPPYNSGRVFEHYRDRRSPSSWRAMIEPRIAAVAELLASDGALVAQIDDTELGPLQMLLDALLGRENRVATVTVVRSASTGHKARNRGPVNVADYLLVYARDKKRFRPQPLWHRRAGYDHAYRTFVEGDVGGPSEVGGGDPDGWRFVPLARAASRALGYASTRAATQALGREGVRQAAARFALHQPARVVRFAQPRYEAVSRAAQEGIVASRAAPEAVLRLRRPGHRDFILKGGNRVLFLADKVRQEEGHAVLVEPLTNVWADIPFQGMAREGGVAFPRNKKPERLLERILALCTEPGDWVLDPFAGSGTTPAVAHKMGRRWVGIEDSGAFDAWCLPRLRRVIDGDDPTGITRARGWKGGGGFAVYA